MTASLSRRDPVHTELSEAIAAALAGGTHLDRHLLLLHERLREMEQGTAAARAGIAGAQPGAPGAEFQRRSLLRSLVSTPARTPLGIAAKLAVACSIDGCFEAAQVAPDGPRGCHVIVSVFLDVLAQAQLLPAARPDRPQ